MTGLPPQPTSEWNAAAPARFGPAAGLVYGGFWIRALAFIVDGLVLGIIASALLPATGVGPFVQIEPNSYHVNYEANAFGGLIGLVYFVGFWAWRAQTPGMMLFTLRVVRADDGGDVDIVRSLLRYAGLIISFAAILMGVIWAGFDARKQGWHDKIGGTIVVRQV